MSTSPFRTTVALVASRARAKLPQAVNGRIEGAVKLVLGHDVVRLDDGTTQVGSSSDPLKVYRLSGQACTCKDFTDGKAPEGWCRHRIAAGIQKRVHELLAAYPDPDHGDALPQPDDQPPVEPEGLAPLPVPHGLDPRHIVTIQGKPFVKFAGLLDLAHQRGLQSLTATWTHNADELSLAHAVAVFPFGTFEECADATPANVNKRVVPHFRRCALTRAKARALRDALNCDMVALEELADEAA